MDDLHLARDQMDFPVICYFIYLFSSRLIVSQGLWLLLKFKGTSQRYFHRFLFMLENMTEIFKKTIYLTRLALSYNHCLYMSLLYSIFLCSMIVCTTAVHGWVGLGLIRFMLYRSQSGFWALKCHLSASSPHTSQILHINSFWIAVPVKGQTFVHYCCLYLKG